MALDLQAILNEAVSEVLGKEGQSINESVIDVVNEVSDATKLNIAQQLSKLNKEKEKLDKILQNPNLGDREREDYEKEMAQLNAQINRLSGIVKGGSDEAKEGIMDKVTGALHKVGKAVEDHPYAAAATGAIAAGLGALGVRKLVKKRGGVRNIFKRK